MTLVRDISNPSEFGAFSRLLDQAFPVPAGAHFFDDFPVWDPLRKTDSSVRRLGVFSGEKLLSVACARITYLKAPHESLKVTIVGAVATDESARGQGLASDTVRFASDWAQSQGAALCLLWGSEHSLYEKLGFELCGQQVRVPLVEFAHEPRPTELRGGLDHSLFELLKKRKTGLVLDNADYRWFSAHKNTTWISSWVNDVCVAYAAIDRGIDLQNIVHEWGGDLKELKKLFGYISTQSPNSEVLCSPADAQAFAAQAASDTEFLALIKILNAESVARAFGEKDIAIFQSAREAFEKYPLWIWGLDAA